MLQGWGTGAVSAFQPKCCIWTGKGEIQSWVRCQEWSHSDLGARCSRGSTCHGWVQHRAPTGAGLPPKGSQDKAVETAAARKLGHNARHSSMERACTSCRLVTDSRDQAYTVPSENKEENCIEGTLGAFPSPSGYPCITPSSKLTINPTDIQHEGQLFPGEFGDNQRETTAETSARGCPKTPTTPFSHSQGNAAPSTRKLLLQSSLPLPQELLWAPKDIFDLSGAGAASNPSSSYSSSLLTQQLSLIPHSSLSAEQNQCPPVILSPLHHLIASSAEQEFPETVKT